MKLKYKLARVFVIASSLFWGVSCEDHRMNNMIEDKVLLTEAGINPQNIFKGEDFVYPLMIAKSGAGQTGGEVQLSVDESLLAAHNGTYTVLPTQYYTVDKTKLSLSSSDYQVPFNIKFDAAGIETLVASTGLKYAIPFKIATVGNGLAVSSENLSYSILVPTVKTPYFGFRNPGLTGLASTVTHLSGPETKYYAFVTTNYYNNWDLTYKVSVDQAALEAYNLENETDHKLMPAEGYKIDESTLKIPKLNNTSTLTYYLLKGKVAKGNYVLPLTITEVSKYGINPTAKTMLIPVSIQD